MAENGKLIEVRDLATYFRAEGEEARAVDGVSFEIRKGETLGAICRRYDANLAGVIAWNAGIRPRRMMPGDRITIWVKPR